MNNKFRFIGSLYLVALFFFVWGVAAGNYKIFPWKYMKAVYGELHEYLNYKDEPKKDIVDEVFLDKLERKAKYDLKGFKLHDSSFKDTGYLLISRYSKKQGESVIELFSIAEEKIIHSWIPPFDKIVAQSPKFEKGGLETQNGWKAIDNNARDKYRPMHPLLIDDGSIAFNLHQGPMVRIDACGSLNWVVDRQFQHSLEMDHLQRLIAPIVVEEEKLYGLKDFRDHGFAYVSLDGALIQEYSIANILGKAATEV